MSIKTEIHCDVCNTKQAYDPSGRGWVVGDRARARELGWIRAGGMDICPEHDDVVVPKRVAKGGKK
jgi:hypothetical protein